MSFTSTAPVRNSVYDVIRADVGRLGTKTKLFCYIKSRLDFEE